MCLFCLAGPSKRGMSAVSMVGTSGDMTPNSSSPISAWSQPLTSHLWPWPQGTTLSGMREMEREGGGKGEGGSAGKWQPPAQELTIFNLFQHGENLGDIILFFFFLHGVTQQCGKNVWVCLWLLEGCDERTLWDRWKKKQSQGVSILRFLFSFFFVAKNRQWVCVVMDKGQFHMLAF